MHQYFSVGEEVILVSENYPRLNGEYKIKSLGGIRTFKILSSGEVFIDFAYGLKDNDTSEFWSQRCLRKKHKPSEFKSFSELIKSTKEVKA